MFIAIGLFVFLWNAFGVVLGITVVAVGLNTLINAIDSWIKARPQNQKYAYICCAVLALSTICIIYGKWMAPHKEINSLSDISLVQMGLTVGLYVVAAVASFVLMIALYLYGALIKDKWQQLKLHLGASAFPDDVDRQMQHSSQWAPAGSQFQQDTDRPH